MLDMGEQGVLSNSHHGGEEEGNKVGNKVDRFWA